MDPVTGGIISTGLNLASGLLSRNNYKKDRDRAMSVMKNTERKRYKWLVQGAQAAGFNPLTVLGATGGQMAQQPAIQSPLSSGAIAAQALAQGFQQYDPVADEGVQLDNDLKRAQLERFETVPPVTATKQVQPSRTPLPAVPTNAPSRDDINPQNFNFFTRGTDDWSGPLADPYGDRPELARVTSGPDFGRYVMAYNGKTWLTPAGVSPSELIEGLQGGALAEFANLGEFLTNRGTQVFVGKRGEYFGRGRPQTRPGSQGGKLRQRYSDEPFPLRDLNIQY